MTTCSIVILTYKGKHHLELMLPTLREAIRNYRGQAIIDTRVVDNGCDEASREIALAAFPGLQYLVLPKNDYILLLNDDIRLDKEMLNELIPMMEQADESLFGISCKNLDWEGVRTMSG